GVPATAKRNGSVSIRRSDTRIRRPVLPRNRSPRVRSRQTIIASGSLRLLRGSPGSPRSGRHCNSLGRQPQDEDIEHILMFSARSSPPQAPETPGLGAASGGIIGGFAVVTASWG